MVGKCEQRAHEGCNVAHTTKKPNREDVDMIVGISTIDSVFSGIAVTFSNAMAHATDDHPIGVNGMRE